MNEDDLNQLEKQYVTSDLIKDPLCVNVVPGGYGGDKVSYLTEGQRKHHRDATSEASLKHWQDEEYIKKCTKNRSNEAKKQWSNTETRNKMLAIVDNSDWYNNGQLQAYIYKDYVPDGWVKGKLSRENPKDSMPYNNGYFTVYWYECPKGFVPGRLLSRNKPNKEVS